MLSPKISLLRCLTRLNIQDNLLDSLHNSLGYMKSLETVSSEFFMYFDTGMGHKLPTFFETGDIDLDQITKQNQLMTIVKGSLDERFDTLMEVMQSQTDCHSTFLQLLIEYRACV